MVAIYLNTPSYPPFLKGGWGDFMGVSMTNKKHGGGQEEEMAKAIHEYYRNLCKEKGWPVKYDVDYTELPDEIKADNLAAAARIQDVLSNAGLAVVPDDYPDNPVRIYY